MSDKRVRSWSTIDPGRVASVLLDWCCPRENMAPALGGPGSAQRESMHAQELLIYSTPRAG